MYVSDIDIPADRVGDVAQRVIDRAIEAARRFGHAALASEHLLLAVAEVEWTLFTDVVRGVGLSAHAVFAAIEEHVRLMPAHAVDVRTSGTAKLACWAALRHAHRAGRPAVEAIDLFLALFEDPRGGPVLLFRQQGVGPEPIIARIEAHARDLELGNAHFKRQFELPPALQGLATNLNLLARQDKLPPVFGRDREIRQVLEILCHRERPNSVMLLGEPGVGKTAIVEGLARRLEFEPDTVPVRLRHCQVVGLQMSAMVAGTALRGMFEERIQNVIREIKGRPNLILFIDEAHTMVGAGAAIGAPSDVANILKPVLGRGEIRVIAATTHGEYKRHIQEDEALARRFRCVRVPEPSLEETRRILYKLRPRLERNYGVRILDEAIETALDMAPRYVRHLRLPDKVVGWLDTASVRAEVDRRCDVTTADVVSVVSQAAQIPEDMVVRDVNHRFADLRERLQRRVVGQREAIEAVTRRLVLNKGPLKNGFARPDGVLLFIGPTGVGKTELAKALAEILFGDEHHMVRLDLSEYQGGAGVDKLIGAPRGVADSAQGGILTNQLADNPFTVVLLDEIEKASSSVLNLFLQAFDEGWITDGRGKRVYLSDAIVIMTSNAGSEHFRKATNPLGFLSREHAIDRAQAEVRRDAERRFSPEFLNRIDNVVLFNPLTRDNVESIARRYLAGIGRTLSRAGKTLEVEDDALRLIVEQGCSAAFGARLLKRLIDERVKLPISYRWREGALFCVRVRAAQIVVEVGRSVDEPGEESTPFDWVA